MNWQILVDVWTVAQKFLENVYCLVLLQDIKSPVLSLVV